MSESAAPANVFTVPPGVAFLPALARAILAGGFPAHDRPPPDPLDLARWTVLLPTRRAARALAAAFLDAGGGEARLLPRIRALGDVDEDELLLGAVDGSIDDVAPAIRPMQRLFVLTSLILDWARRHPRARLSQALVHSPVQALSLAQSLARLIDSFETEQIELAAIAGLVEDELAGHQEMVLDFLELVRVRLPDEMSRLGVISPAERRNRLMGEEARRLETNGSTGPIIAAGSTGSIPATARLLAVVARLANGAVVLPGLDQGLDRESWEARGAQHPQFGMRELLKRIAVDRREVRLLAGINEDASRSPRAWLASEIMRPAETSERWYAALAQGPERLDAATDGLTAIAAPGQREEAAAIALIMRRTLEEPGRTAALVTPDRQLARRVKAELGRWSIDIDDSAGEPLIRTPAGAFAALIAEAAASRLAARDLVALFNHPFCRFGLERGALGAAAADLEVAVLRGQPLAPGPAGLAAALDHAVERAASHHAHPLARRIDATRWQSVRSLVDRLIQALEPLERLFAGDGEVGLDELFKAHIAAMEAAAAGPHETALLWAGEVGEMLSELFGELLDDAAAFPPLTARDYPPLIASLMQAVPVRPRHGRHPRLVILGLLEARLVDADVTILGGLNDGVWPAEAEADPWLNRPQRAKLGLPLPDRRIGLAAHDFAQGLAAGTVTLTWSKKIGGQPAVPSRWILRLMALLAAGGRERALAPRDPWLAWVLGLDPTGEARAVPRPRPQPPVPARPRRLSVTGVEELIRDPYATFGRRILKLEPLETLGAEYGPAERGRIVHTAIERFTRRWPGPLPDDAEDKLLDEARAAFADMAVDEATAALWWPQMQRIARWFIACEQALRDNATAQHVEVSGRIEFPVRGQPFILTGRADRVDELDSGALRIIDYKTGALPSFKDSAKDYSPQLFLEGYLAGKGAFGDICTAPTAELMYIRLSGGDPAGETKVCKDDVAAAVEATGQNLLGLLDGYADPETAYEAKDWSSEPDRAGDYGHLSRWREWAAGWSESGEGR